MNTNYNNVYSDYIGASGTYSITDYINNTSNSLSSNIVNTSNILNTKINNSSNSLQTQIIETSNLVYKDSNLNTIVKITAQNPTYPASGDPKEMRFLNVNNEYLTKIIQTGELFVYHPLTPLPVGYSAGWWSVEGKIAFAITETQGLRFDVTNLQALTGSTAITDATTATSAVASSASGLATVAGAGAVAGGLIADGNYGAVAVGLAGGALFSTLGYLSYQAQVRSNLSNNGFTTQGTQVGNNMSNAYLLLADNISNINIAKGFINCNIQRTQIISNLSITSNITASNLNAIYFKYNGTELSTYLNNNYLNSTTANATFLAKSGGTMTGGLAITPSTVAPPSVGNFGGTGDRIVLYNGTGTIYPFSVGINTNSLWYSVPSGASHNFYINGTSILSFNSTLGTFTGTLNATTALQEGGTSLSSKYLTLSGGTMSGSLNINGTNQFLSFGSRLQDNIIRLYGTVFGFGINDFTLRYNANNTHKFYCDGVLRGTIDPNGFSGSGSNITNLNYNNIATNKPDLTLYLTTANASTTYLAKSGGTMTGGLAITPETVAPPSVGNFGGTGDRIVLYNGTGTTYPYSVGINTNSLWNSVPTGASFNWYIGGLNRMSLTSSPNLILGNGCWFSVGTGATPTAPLSIGNTLSSVKIISIYDYGDPPNNFQFTGFGNVGGLSFNIPESIANFKFVVGQSSTTSREVARITGNGDLLLLAQNIANPLSTAEQRIINQGSFLTSVFGGDNLISGYWGVAININGSGLGDNADAGFTKIGNSSSFTINTRSSGTTTSFDKTLFNVRNNGRVGIGSTDPHQLLDIYSDDTSINCHIRIRANTAREAGIFLDRTSTSWSIQHKGTAFTGSVNNLSFMNNSSSSILELTQGGNVGIGSSTPLSKLEVYGTTPIVSIKGTNEGDIASLYLATPFDTSSAYKCALICEGRNTYSRSKLHFCLDGTANNAVTYNAGLANSRMTINYDGSVGIGNSLSTAPLWIGRPDVVSNGFIVFSRNSGGNRNALIGYTTSFFFTIGDYGNVNSTANTNVPQLAIIYNAPTSAIVVETSGRVVMAYGFGTTSSDERIKTNIKTIENALDKVLLLRGVEYNDIRIEPDEKKFGLIAQEVELIIPEIVKDNEYLKHKTLDYTALIPHLIEAVKEQQKQINEMKALLRLRS